MSYDIFLVRFERGVPAPIAAPAFWELLASAWQAPPDALGFVRLARDGAEADLYTGSPGEKRPSVMINHFGGDAIMDLLVELARAGDAVIVGPELPPLLTRAEQRDHLPPDLALQTPAVVSSGQELTEVIARLD